MSLGPTLQTPAAPGPMPPALPPAASAAVSPAAPPSSPPPSPAGLRPPVQPRARRWTLLLPPLLALAAALLALSLGRYPLPAADLLRYLGALLGWVELPADRLALLHNLIVQIRLPRVAAAVLVGAALSCAGGAYQALFRNPLVSPGLLGVLAGASAGAALGIVAGGSWWWVQAGAFTLGLAAAGFALAVARAFSPGGEGALVMLILGGIVSGALFTALLSVLKVLADPYNQLPAIVYWLMGSLGQVSLRDLGWAAAPMAAGIALLCALGRALDALAMGDDEARTLGVPVAAVRLSTIVAATLVSALTVSVAGMIGWIGLIVPHIARLLVGPRNSRLLPATVSLGAAFLLLADTLARNLFSAELPIGIVTELLGIPAFLLVLRRVRRGWS